MSRELARNRLHVCRRRGCPRRVGRRYVFCERCWTELSRELQTELYRTYKAPGWRRALTWAQLEHAAADQVEMFPTKRRAPCMPHERWRDRARSRQDARSGAIGPGPSSVPRPAVPAGASPPLGAA